RAFGTGGRRAVSRGARRSAWVVCGLWSGRLVWCCFVRGVTISPGTSGHWDRKNEESAAGWLAALRDARLEDHRARRSEDPLRNLPGREDLIGLQILEIPRRVVGVECPVPDDLGDNICRAVVPNLVSDSQAKEQPTRQVVVGQEPRGAEPIGGPKMGDGPRPRID